MARDFVMQVIANDRASRALRDTADAFDTLERHARESGRGVSREMRDLGDGITAARTTLQELNEEYTRTGDPQHLRGIQEQTARLREMEQALRHMGENQGIDWSHIGQEAAQAGAHAGNVFSEAFSGGVSGAFGMLPQEAQSAIIAAVATAAVAGSVVVVGAAEAAILAAIGGGGLAAGVAMALRDPRVLQEWGDLGHRAVSTLERATEPFKPALISVATTLGDAFERQAPRLEAMFGRLATRVEPLGAAIGDMLDELMPGLDAAMEGAGPVLDEIAEQLPGMGAAIGDLLANIGDVGPEVAAVLGDVMEIVDQVIVGFGDWLNAMGKVADAFEPIADSWGDMLEAANKINPFAKIADDLALAEGSVGSTATAMARGLTEIADSARQAQAETRTLTEVFDDLNGRAWSAHDAEREYQAALDDATQSIREHGRTLDLNTEKGRANDEALRRIIDTTIARSQALYDQTFASNGAAAAEMAAANATEQGRQALIRTAQQMGLSRAQAEAYAAQLMQIPREWHTKVSIDTSAAMEAIARVKWALAQIGQQGNAAGVYADYYYRQVMEGKASGGPVSAGTPYVVGEAGPEVFVPTSSGSIIPNGSGGAALAGANITVNVYPGLVTTPEELDTQIVAALQRFVAANGPLVGVAAP